MGSLRSRSGFEKLSDGAMNDISGWGLLALVGTRGGSGTSVPQSRPIAVGHIGRMPGRLIVCAPEPSSAREFPDVAVFCRGRVSASQAERVARAVGRVLAHRGITFAAT